MEADPVADVMRYIETPNPFALGGPVILPVERDPSLHLARRGNLLRLQGGSIDGEQRGGGKRGVVKGLSRQARARLMRLVASIDRTFPASMWLFVTLTYPAEFPDDARVYHRHLDTWFKRLRRRYPETSALWKCEYQRRGAPHFHLLIFGRAFIDRGWLSQSWYSVVGSQDNNHLLAGTQVKAVRSWGGVTYYAAKYIAKTQTPADDLPTGRLWGVFNRENLPIEVLDLPLLWPEFHTLRRCMRRWARQAKPQSWCPRPAGARRPFARPAGARGAGMSLFVAEPVAVRLFRALPELWEIDPEDHSARHKTAFRAWSDRVPG